MLYPLYPSSTKAENKGKKDKEIKIILRLSSKWKIPIFFIVSLNLAVLFVALFS